jgi:uncharacterized protein (TIGR03435 family)
VNISGATIKLLIQQAYDVRQFQILGGPAWINSERYDVIAKVDRAALAGGSGNVPDQRKVMEQQRERLQALLADRCRLKIRRETRELQAYVLVAAKSGPKLKEAAPASASPDGKEGQQPPRGTMRMGRGQIIGQSVPLDLLVQMLSQQLGRPVIDKTGLAGTYDFTLEWTPDPGQGLGAGFGGPAGTVVGKEPPRIDNPEPAEPSGTSVFVAIQEQLGLKLEPQKAPVEMIVIESVEKPSEN